MRVLQVTNIISHHQLPLARSLAASLGSGNFRFAATEMPDPERRRLGWSGTANEQWVLRPGENDADRRQFEAWWNEADVVLCGERLPDFMENRLADGKLTFYMSERWWKPSIGIARLLHPGFARMALRFRRMASSPYFHFLPMGDYSAADMRRIASFDSRMWRWGYFTDLPDPLPSCEKQGEGFRVMWAGRMLDWKRVDTLIRAFSRLIVEQPDAILTLVGDGPKRGSLEALAEKLLPPGSFSFLPPQPVTEILKMMRQHNVYVLASNAYEGWGAVVNEAMSEGCAVIASEAAGAAKTLIRHGENGLLFAPGNWKRLGKLLCDVNRDTAWRIHIARNGQNLIADCWSPATAAERFLSFCEALTGKRTPPVFNEGPMSRL